jgi:hypothetical protein
MTQNSLQGGNPVCSTSTSKWAAVGKRLPDSHVLSVGTETPKSLESCLSGILCFRRQLLKAVAKLVRMSQRNFDVLATAGIYALIAAQGKAAKSCHRFNRAALDSGKRKRESDRN